MHSQGSKRQSFPDFAIFASAHSSFAVLQNQKSKNLFTGLSFLDGFVEKCLLKNSLGSQNKPYSALLDCEPQHSASLAG